LIQLTGENGLITGVVYAAAAAGAITMDAFEEIKNAKEDNEKVELCIAKLKTSLCAIENAAIDIDFFEKNDFDYEAIQKITAKIPYNDPKRINLEFYLLLRQLKKKNEDITSKIEKDNVHFENGIKEIQNCLFDIGYPLNEISIRVKELFEQNQKHNNDNCKALKTIEKILGEIHETERKNKIRFTSRFVIDLRAIARKKLSGTVQKIIEGVYLSALYDDEGEPIASQQELDEFEKVATWAFSKGSSDLIERTLSLVDDFDDMDLNSDFYSRLDLVVTNLKKISRNHSIPEFDRDFSRSIDLLTSVDDEDTSDFSRNLTHLIFREAKLFINNLPTLTPELIANVARNNASFVRFIEQNSRGSIGLKKTRLAGSNQSNPVLYQIDEVFFNSLAADLDYVQILGIQFQDRRFTKYMLTAAYIRMTIADGSQEVYTEKELARNKFILIRGSAGSGKSTLLQWIAVNCARGAFDDELTVLNGSVPVFVRLKDFRNQPFPSLLDAARKYQGNATYSEFEDWFRKAADAGLVILLCDGFDEISELKRGEFEIWLRMIINDHRGNIRVIVTGRPSAISQGLLIYKPNSLKSYRGNERVTGKRASLSDANKNERAGDYPLKSSSTSIDKDKDYTPTTKDYLLDFRIYDIQPMSKSAVLEFVEKWHEACSLNTDQDKRDRVLALKGPLQSLMRGNRALFDLCSRPLVCAMVCFLHHQLRIRTRGDSSLDGEETMDFTRRNIYSNCSDAMIFLRDSESNVDLSQYSVLRKEQRYKILENIAQWIFQNGESCISEQQIGKIIKKTKVKFKSEEQSIDIPKTVKLITERTLLQATGENEYEFLHKSFLEFFCARHFVDMDDFGKLAMHSDNLDWEEVIILSCGIAGEKKASDLIKKIIDKSSKAEEPLRLLLLAAACSENVLTISPDIVKKLTECISMYLPPNSMSLASEIAKIGVGLVSYLSFATSLKQSQRVACIRALSLIGGGDALTELLSYAKNPKITNRESYELLKSCESNPEYTQSLGTLINIRVRDSRSPRKIVNVKSLSDAGGMIFTDVDAFFAGSHPRNLRRITINSLNGQRSLDFLEFLNRKVTFMRFGNCWTIRDLSFLREFPNLDQLELIDIRSLQITGEIADLLGLRHLKLTGCVSLIDIRPLLHMKNCHVVLKDLNPSCFVPAGFVRKGNSYVKHAEYS
jgi:energy-coupling factor transporter ATP-binding protein EcfA2